MFKFKSEAVGRLLKKLSKYKYILLVVAAGLLLLALPTGSKKTVETAAAPLAEEETFDLEAFEQKLRAALQRMEGVGKTTVVLTLKTGSQRVLAADRSVRTQSSTQGEVTDYDMDSSETTVVISSGSGTQEAVVVRRVYPQFQGALVICEGGGSAAVRLSVTEAVSAVTGLGSDCIKVTKMS